MAGIDANEPKSFAARETQVLSNFGSGLADAVPQLWSDIKDAGSNLAQNPLGYTAHLVKEHWQDPLAGAVIAAVAPKGLAKAAILLYSARGLGTATWDAARAAADPKADLEAVSAQYRAALAHQGAGFVEQMPLAMLGGMIGRGTTNSLVGKNLGLAQVVSGRVSLADVKARAWNMHDSLFPPKTKLVVFDSDNTLFRFSQSLASGMEEAIPQLSRTTKISEAELYKSIGQEMDKVSSFSYPWALELALGDRLKVGQPGGMTVTEFQSTVADPFWKTVEDSMTTGGKAFPEVVPTLKALGERNIPTAMLTNATSNVVRRAENMGLTDGKLIQRVYAIEDRPEPTTLPPELFQSGARRLAALFPTDHSFEKYTAFPRDWAKPDARGLAAIVKDYGLRPRQVLMVGDSVSNDMRAAQLAGTRGAHIKHEYTTAEHEAVLRRLSAEAKAKQAPNNGEPFVVAPPQFIEVNSLDGILNHLEPRANYFQIGRSLRRAMIIRPELTPAIGAFGIAQIGDHDPASKNP